MEKEPAQKMYTVKCSRCTISIETTTAPAPKMNGFLCNNCHMKWLDIEKKLDGHVYADEKRDAFIKFVNSLAHLKTFF